MTKELTALEEAIKEYVSHFDPEDSCLTPSQIIEHSFFWGWKACESQDNWISVSERLPEMGELVLVYNTESARLIAKRLYITEDMDQWDWFAFFADGENCMGELTATHWQHLPAIKQDGK